MDTTDVKAAVKRILKKKWPFLKYSLSKTKGGGKKVNWLSQPGLPEEGRELKFSKKLLRLSKTKILIKLILPDLAQEGKVGEAADKDCS